MGKAIRIYFTRESAINRLTNLANDLALELYESLPSSNDDKVIAIIEQLDRLADMLKHSNIEKVMIYKHLLGIAKTRSNTLRIQLPHSEITWEKFASLSKND